MVARSFPPTLMSRSLFSSMMSIVSKALAKSRYTISTAASFVSMPL